MIAKVAGGILVFVLIVTCGWNLFVFDGSRGAFADKVARKVIARLGDIAVDDLYTPMDALDRESNWSDTYHFKPAALDLQARQVSAACLKAAGL